MKRSMMVVLALALVVGMCTSAFSATVVKQGAKRVVLAAAGGNADLAGLKTNFAAVIGKFGYFVADPLEIGITEAALWFKNVSPSVHSMWAAITMLHLAYHFNTAGTVQPYVGLQGGEVYYDLHSLFGAGTTRGGRVAFGAFGGVDFLIGENSILFIEYNYLQMKPVNTLIRTNLILAGFGLVW